MFHREDARKRSLAEEGHQALGMVEGVGRVGKGHVEGRRRQLHGEPEGVTPVHPGHRLESQGGDVGAEGGEGSRCLVDEVGGGRATGKRLEAQGTAPA